MREYTHSKSFCVCRLNFCCQILVGLNIEVETARIFVS